MTRFLCLIVLVLGASFPVGAQESNPFIDLQGHLERKSVIRNSQRDADKFRVLEEFKAPAPFANLPFLKLRQEQKIVIAQTFEVPIRARKGMSKDKADSVAVWSKPSFWVVQGELVNYFDQGSTTWVKRINVAPISAEIANEKYHTLNLEDGNDIAYFDWEPTRANADALLRFCRPARGARVSLANLKKINELLQPDYAEYESSRISSFTKESLGFAPGFQEQSNKTTYPEFVYAGIEFDHNEIYVYQWILNTHGWGEEHETLVRKPDIPDYPGAAQQYIPPNFRATLAEDVRRRMDAQDARIHKWSEIIDHVLRPNP